MAAATNNLTRTEAASRAGLLSEVAYEIDLDLTGDGPTFTSATTVRFRASSPGASTFIDLTAPALTSASLNGTDLGSGAFDGHRLRLDGLAADNELRVVAECAYDHTGVGLHRFTDPVDGETYLYTQFEPFDAHRVFPCFDQPDLKGTFAFAVTAPEAWEVVSNGVATREGGRWTYETTPLLSTYVTAIVAGPYHAVHGEHLGIPLGVYCRRSLAQYLDADEILDVTKEGFDHFPDAFGCAYPFGKYDQLFVPEFNAGAMENVACVTISENYVFRSKVTVSERERRAETILHEMAHMWFGDLVTMRWWDDLWLNESFATYISYDALVRATRYTNAWVTFGSGWKNWAYRQDQLPSTHPIVADAPDVDTAKTNFDGITYAKGASVLRQLVAWVGDEGFFEGVRDYFRTYAYGNTELTDFLGALEGASGRDLRSWSAEWLERAGVNTLRPAFTTEGDTFTSFAIEQEAPEQWPTLRRHRLAVGLYDDVSGRLVRRERIELDVEGAHTEVPQIVGATVPALVVVNDGDLAYAKIRLDERSLATLTDGLSRLDDDLARALCWSSAWDMLREAELPAHRFLDLVVGNAGAEDEISMLQGLLARAFSAAVVFAEPSRRNESRARLAEAAHRELHRAEPGSDRQLTWAQSFVGAARSEKYLGALRRLLDGSLTVEGLAVDTDLRWQIVRALSAAGVPDAAEIVAAELERDPTDVGQRRAAAARAARPDAAAKAEAWAAIAEDKSLPLATMEAMMAGFQQPDQEALLDRYIGPYFEALRPMWDRGNPEVALSFAEAMYPGNVPGDEVLARTDEYLAGDVISPIRRFLLEGRDQVERVLRARAADVR